MPDVEGIGMKQAAAYCVWGSGLILMALQYSCTVPGTREDRRDLVHQDAELRTLIRPIPLPESPSLLEHVYTHPPRSIRQAFSWSRGGNEWRLVIRDRNAEYAGFTWRRPYDLSQYPGHMSLYMEIEPPDAALSLAVGLISGQEDDTRVISIIPLTPYRISTRPRSIIAVPLTEFENGSAGPGSGLIPAGALDWQRITEIRLIRLDPGTVPDPEIIVHRIRFAPDTWIRVP